MLTLVTIRASIGIVRPRPIPIPAAVSLNLNLTGTARGRKKARFGGYYNYSCIRRQIKMSAKCSGEGEILEEEEVVVQYVVLRRDLIDSWPLGSVVTQGCHASVAAIWEHKDDTSTLRYCSASALDSMHKVTLEVKGEPQIVNLSEKLKSNGILHKLWIEQPENIPTCLATKPYPKSMVSPFFRKLKLCK